MNTFSYTDDKKDIVNKAKVLAKFDGGLSKVIIKLLEEYVNDAKNEKLENFGEKGWFDLEECKKLYAKLTSPEQYKKMDHELNNVMKIHNSYYTKFIQNK